MAEKQKGGQRLAVTAGKVVQDESGVTMPEQGVLTTPPCARNERIALICDNRIVNAPHALLRFDEMRLEMREVRRVGGA